MTLDTTLEEEQQRIRTRARRGRREPSEAQPEDWGTWSSRGNVGRGERWASLASGAVAALVALARGGIPGLLIGGVGGALLARGATGRSLLYRALDLDTTPEGRAGVRQGRGLHMTQAFTVSRSPEDLYRYWRQFENLPRVMSHLESVRMHDERRSHWTLRAPRIAGGQVSWDAEVTEDLPDRRIAWRSLHGSEVEHVGSVTFEPGPRGTVVRVEMRYHTPAGRLGNLVAKLFGEGPEAQLREDLRAFKRVMETGEAPTVEGQPHGTCGVRPASSSP